MTIRTTITALLLAACLSPAAAHMEVKSPPPRLSKFGTSPNPDYNMVAPLAADGSQFSCKGYPKAGNVATLTPGGSINVDITGGATHDGGHCQFAISYDDKTWVVLKTVLNNCFDGSSIGSDTYRYSVPLPSSLPASSTATLAWAWINGAGNAEYYMNCMDVSVSGGASSGTVSGPQLFVANQPGFPTLADFKTNAGTDTGVCYLNARPTVKVAVSGGKVMGVSGASVGVYGKGASCSGSGPVTGASSSGNGNAPVATAKPAATSIARPVTTQVAQTPTTTTNGRPVKTITVVVKVAVPAAAKPTQTMYLSPTSPTASSSSSTSGGSCTPGQMKCVSPGVGTSWMHCDASGKWLTQQCAPGTKCYEAGAGILCNY
ncbi:hypothetical protein HDV00_009095 [Rhizophlyctis rosea]|nr:hypothetical protein HDV00_009095 [Rhizophlyctis rosea]